jgi:UDP-N-acetylmuramate dehydrogenase
MLRDPAALPALLESPVAHGPLLVLGEGSNLLFAADFPGMVLRPMFADVRMIDDDGDAATVRAEAGAGWDRLVDWTLERGLGGLENLALIPGLVGAAPIQNIGAYGAEVAESVEHVEAWDRRAGRSLITRVRFRLPRPWQPVTGYLDIERRMHETGIAAPSPRELFDWVCAIRRAKLPDPAVVGNAGSFFKNPVVTPEQCRDIIGRDPEIVHYPMPDGTVKLAAGWMIDACGWKGKTVGQAGVYEKQALVLVNRGGAIGSEVMTLARAIQESVYGRFGIRLEPEPVVV